MKGHPKNPNLVLWQNILVRQFSKFALIVLFLGMLGVLPSVTHSSHGGPHLRLATDNTSVFSCQDIVVDMLVEDAPLVYGAESHVSFDPTILSMVAQGHGDFLSTDPDSEAFILQNRFDNVAGTSDYALTLVNPAQAVSGNGLLARLTFQAQAGGTTTITIQSGAFGTPEGVTIPATTAGIQLTISHDPTDTDNDGVPDDCDPDTYIKLYLPLILVGNGQAVQADSKPQTQRESLPLRDANLVKANFGLAVPPADPRADLNDDGRVNVQDLVLSQNILGDQNNQ